MGIARRQIRWNGWGWAAHQDSLAECEPFWHWLAGELGMPALLATPARALDDIVLPAPLLAPNRIAAFANILGAERVLRDDYERAFHARGRSYHDLLRLRAGDLSGAPDAVLYPRGEDEVLAILQAAARAKIPVIPFGGGTSSVGGVTAMPGSITIDLSGMDQLLDVDMQSGTATMEAGITGPALEKALAAKGLTLGHAPQSFEFSSLGGWIATSGADGRAAGWLAGARLATPQGVLDTKDGRDLKQLVLGSEGIFGVITRATVRVRPLSVPMGRAFLFRDFTAGSAAAREGGRAEIPCTTLQLSDAAETRFEQALADLKKPPGWNARIATAWRAARHFGFEAALLIAGFSDAAAARRFETLAKKHGAMALGETPARHWQEERFRVPYRLDPLLDRGVGRDKIETSASWSCLPGLYAGVRAALEAAMQIHAPRPGAHGLVLCHLNHAHAGGANLNFTILFPRQLENEIAQWRAIRRAAQDAIRAHGGTTSPCEGVGEDYLKETGSNAIGLAALRGLKTALDPDGILNPGKRIPPI